MAADTDTSGPAGDSLAHIEAGLDALETSAEPESSRLKHVAASVLPPIAALVLILAVWQILYAAKIWPDWKLPGPSQVFGYLKDT